MKTTDNPCFKCSDCCTYVATEIDEPTDEESFQNVRWYLVHQNVIVFKASDDDKWYIQFNTPCRMLTPDGACSIYESRPDICRTYASDNCTTHGVDSAHTLLFANVGEWEAWWANNNPTKRKKVLVKK